MVLLLCLVPRSGIKPALASPALLAWSAVETPSSQGNIVVSPSEINVMVIGSDDLTFYALDIPDRKLFKSGDGGITWPNDLSAQLIIAGAAMPIWNFAVAPDDLNFIVAIVSDNITFPVLGPKRVYISTDGGATWQNTSFTALANEWISCVDISVAYGGTNRDIAIGTRTGTGTGKVYAMINTGFASWIDQGLLPSDVVALKFSPNYPSDNSLIVVSSDQFSTATTGTQLHLGSRDTATNTTPNWDAAVAVGFPVLLWDFVFAPPTQSPGASEIITADLELPSDFSGGDQALRRFYVSTDTAIPNRQFGVYRVDDNVPHRINPPTIGRISSIAYFGTYATGVLLVGEATANPTLTMVNIWRSINCTATAPAWLKSDTYKSPTGGGNSGLANSQVAWNSDGTRAYCGTSSACLGVFIAPDGTVNCPEWPEGYLRSVPLDESAFSVSPYAPAYQQLLSAYGKTQDTDIGNIWNQLSLIDTEMDLLSDDAALQSPKTGENLAAQDYDVLYLFSISDNLTVPVSFDSLWRSTSNPLGRTWERVLCIATTGSDTILRVKQTSYDDTDRSDVIVFADVGTDVVGDSPDEGQTWGIRGLTTITDLALSRNTVMYILNNRTVYRYDKSGPSWVFDKQLDTQLDAGHTIAVPLKNPGDADMVLVGEAGPPNGQGRIAYTDFDQLPLKSNPPDVEKIPPPVPGDAHVIFDDKFDQNNLIYNATRDFTNTNGKIYRWTIGKSTVWDEIAPPNSAFFGLAQRNDVLYGAWRNPQIPAILANNAGVDRTLFPRHPALPPPEWDYLVAELPLNVFFTREPSSLKVSSNDNIMLWAIDNQPYNLPANTGRLWEYTDIAAKVGPVTTSPPSGSDIPVDPRSGRAVEVNFAWRQISYITVYEIQIAKDIDFHNRVLVNEHITPTDQLAPTVYAPAGALLPVSGSNIGSFGNLESGHTYYWRVRARAAITGEVIRSPWSATMYFTVEAGLRTASPYPTVILFGPQYGARNVSTSPGFSWSGLPGITEYEFILSKDASLQNVIVKADVPATSYLYDGKLNYNTTYFWQVRAIEPVVSDASAIGTFTVMVEQKPVTPAVEKPAPIPTWVWWIIAIFTALVAAMIAFAMVKPSYGRPGGGGKLINVKPVTEKPESPAVKKLSTAVFDKPKNAIVKVWKSTLTAVRQQRFFKNRSSKQTDGSQVIDSQEKVDITK